MASKPNVMQQAGELLERLQAMQVSPAAAVTDLTADERNAIKEAIASMQWAATLLDIPANRDCQFNDSIAGLHKLLEVDNG